MRLLDNLVRNKPTTRYTLNDYAGWLLDSFNFNGWSYPVGLTTTQQGQPTEPIEANFVGHVQGALKANGIVAALELVRVSVFSQAQFQFRRRANGRPGKLFGTQALAPLEKPWPGGTTGALLARMILDVDMAGNNYLTADGDDIVRLRPDWVDILLAPRTTRLGKVGFRKVGYAYYDGGGRDGNPTVLMADEVAHWAPMPDPLAEFRGMSWITPVAREVMGDSAYRDHKLQFVENAATPNLAVTLAKEIGPDQFDMFVDLMEESHQGIRNAYKTLYLGGGADVTVVGADMKQLDFKVVQGSGETRIAAASGVGAVIAQFSEGMAGSALNAGNYAAARRRFSDITMRHLWQDACGALAPLVTVPPGSQLWYDDSDIPFLQEDAKDAADIFNAKSEAIRTLTDGGYEPQSVIDAVNALDPALLVHSGLLSVQLQAPGTTTGEPAGGVPAPPGSPEA